MRTRTPDRYVYDAGLFWSELEIVEYPFYLNLLLDFTIGLWRISILLDGYSNVLFATYYVHIISMYFWLKNKHWCIYKARLKSGQSLTGKELYKSRGLFITSLDDREGRRTPSACQKWSYYLISLYLKKFKLVCTDLSENITLSSYQVQFGSVYFTFCSSISVQAALF